MFSLCFLQSSITHVGRMSKKSPVILQSCLSWLCLAGAVLPFLLRFHYLTSGLGSHRLRTSTPLRALIPTQLHDSRSMSPNWMALQGFFVGTLHDQTQPRPFSYTCPSRGSEPHPHPQPAPALFQKPITRSARVSNQGLTPSTSS